MLNERERRFVEAYMGASGGNATAAAIAAGYSAKTAASIASRLLRKVNILEALQARIAADPHVATREDRQHFWTATMLGAGPYATLPIEARLKASELLGRSQGDFIAKHEHSGPKGGAIPIAASLTLALRELSTADLAARAEALAQQLKDAG